MECFVKWANEEIAETNIQINIQDEINRTTKNPRNINWRLRALVLLKDEARCKMCGNSPQNGAILHVDHIKPWSKGGLTVLENLQILCQTCNIGKSNIELE